MPWRQAEDGSMVPPGFYRKDRKRGSLVYYDPNTGTFRLNPRAQISGWSAHTSGGGTTQNDSPTTRHAQLAFINRQATQIGRFQEKKSQVKKDVTNLQKHMESGNLTKRDKKLVETLNLEKEVAAQQEWLEKREGGDVPSWLTSLTEKAPFAVPGLAVAKKVLSAEPVETRIADPESGLNRMFDLMSRGQYTGVGFLKGATSKNKEYTRSRLGNLRYVNPLFAVIDPRHPAESVGRLPSALVEGAQRAGQGFLGKEKHTGSKVLAENFNVKGPVGAVQGFGVDLAGDPSTAATMAAAPAVKGFLKVGKGARGLKSVEEGGSIVERLIRKAGEEELARGGSNTSAQRIMQGMLKSDMVDPNMAQKHVDDWLKEYGQGWTPKSRNAIRKDARQQYVKHMKEQGLEVDKKEWLRVGDDAAEAAQGKTHEFAQDLIRNERNFLETMSKRNQIEFRVAGKPIAISEKAGKVTGGLGKVSREWKYSKNAMHALDKVFRTDVETGKAFHTAQQQFTNRAHGVYSQQVEDLRKLFNGRFDRLGITDEAGNLVAKGKSTNRKQRRILYYALDQNRTTGIMVPGKKGAMSVEMLDKDMTTMFDEAKRIIKNDYDRQVEAGVLDPSVKGQEFKPNYVYQTYKNDWWDSQKSLIGTPITHSKYGKYKKFPSATAAKGAINDIPLIDDVADMLAHRLAKTHRETAEYDFMKFVGNKFGAKVKGKSIHAQEMRKLADEDFLEEGSSVHPAISSGIYLDKDTARALRDTQNILKNDETMRQMEHLIDRVQGIWKQTVIMTPGHQVRNLIGDVFVNMLDGVTNPRRYEWASKLVTPEDTKGFQAINQAARARTIRIGGVEVTGDDIIQWYDGMGLRTGFLRAERNVLPTTALGRARRPVDWWKNQSERREDMTRIAHFIDALVKEAPSSAKLKNGAINMQEIAERAAMRVRKYNFDYNDLTPIERKWFRRAVPFYTYMRKSMPLLLETALTRPGRLAVQPKISIMMNNLVGNPQNEETYPGGTEGIVPDYIRNTPNVQLTGGNEEQDPIFWQPDFPMNQMQEMFGGFAEGGSIGEKLGAGLKGMAGNIMDQGSPLLGVPFEWATGHEFGKELRRSKGPGQMLLNSFPQTAAGNKLVAPTEGDATIPVAGQEVPERLFNMLTGSGVRRITQDRQQGELRSIQDVVLRLLREREAKRQEEINKRWEK